MSERTVVVSEVKEGQAGKAFEPSDSSISWEPLKFEQVLYENFHAEYAVVDGNFVVHFFVHPDALGKYGESALERWWQREFASVMSDVAQEHFKATKPRVMAKYTMETASWWFKAQGYGHLLDPVAFLFQFFDQIDQRVPPP